MLELKNLEKMNFIIDETKFDEKFREKNTQFFKAFNKAVAKDSDMIVYYAESDGSDYYDLIAVEKEGIFNCIPVSLFVQYMGMDENKFENTYRELQEGLPFSVISRDDLDEMIRTKNIEKETDEFMKDINKQSEICDIIKNLTNGESLILSTITNQFGEEVNDLELYINSNGLFEKSYINCYSSSEFGLGTCQCNSHPASMEEIISPKEAMELVNNFIIKNKEENELKQKEREQIAKMLQMCY